MIDKDNVIDFIELQKRNRELKSTEEVRVRKEQFASLIDKAGLRGFFHGHSTPEPTGIVLDYDVEEVKKQIEPNA